MLKTVGKKPFQLLCGRPWRAGSGILRLKIASELCVHIQQKFLPMARPFRPDRIVPRLIVLGNWSAIPEMARSYY